MNLHVDAERVIAACETVRSELLSERTVGGHWVGELGSSPLATATAVSALVIAHGNCAGDAASGGGTDSDRAIMERVVQGDLSELIVESLHWLAQRQNDDGGWGDTERGRSTVPATMLVQAVFRLTCVPAKYEGLTDRAEDFLAAQGGIAALKKRFAKDKSLLAPILANSALAGLVPWRQVPALPFEWSCLPRDWYLRLRLPVTSDAIPVLVAIGQLKFRHDPPRNPITRLLRLAARKGSLAVLQQMQPENGGFLESTPLTAFVVMGLAGLGLADHPVVRRGIEFLLASVRSDASWPIDANHATWNTTLAMNALADAPAERQAQYTPPRQYDSRPLHGDWHQTLRAVDMNVETAHASSSSSGTPSGGFLRNGTADPADENCLDWLLDCQRAEPDLYTGAQPGGWAQTDLAGGVPDADATSAALLALARWRNRYPRLKQHRLQLAACRGIQWLLDLQNADGGWPSFCRDWNTLLRDRSACDLTAHAVRALAAWQRVWEVSPPVAERSARPPVAIHRRVDSAIELAQRYLENEQRNDGSFVPLKFGNQLHPEGHNLVYGTARVVTMCAELGRLDSEMAQGAARWLLGVQHANGGWGPPRSSPATSLSNVYRTNSSRAEDALASFCSVEETALAVEALLPLAESNQLYARAVQNGLKWLVEAVEQGRLRQPAPIGFCFAGLWHHERLYPLVFAAAALGQSARHLAPLRAVASPVG